MTERCVAEWKGGQALCGASKREPLSQVTCVDVYGPWALACNGHHHFKMQPGTAPEGLRGTQSGRAGTLTEYLPYGSCLCMSLSPLDAVWPPARADPVALLPTHSAQVKLGSP